MRCSMHRALMMALKSLELQSKRDRMLLAQVVVAKNMLTNHTKYADVRQLLRGADLT